MDSLLLSAPGGSLIAEVTPDLRAFITAERSALARDDLDGAVEAKLAWRFDGPQRDAGLVDPTLRHLVRQMQRRAFEPTAGWDDVKESELDPAALDRLAEIRVPTLVLVGALDLQAIHDATRHTARDRRDRRRPSRRLARHRPPAVDGTPDDFLALLRDWLTPRKPTDLS